MKKEVKVKHVQKNIQPTSDVAISSKPIYTHGELNVTF